MPSGQGTQDQGQVDDQKGVGPASPSRSPGQPFTNSRLVEGWASLSRHCSRKRAFKVLAGPPVTPTLWWPGVWR